MEAKIKSWMYKIFPKPGDIFRIKTLIDILPLADNFSSPEDIFLILYNKKYISSHISKVELIKEWRESGIKQHIPTSIPFHITDEGILLLNSNADEHKNQLKLDL